MLGLDTLFPLLDGLLVLILARQHGNGDADASGIVGINHGRVACSSSLEDGVLLRGQVYNLATPAEANDTEGCNVLVLALDLLDDLGNAADGLGWCTGGLEELAETLALLLLSWLSVILSWIRTHKKTHGVRRVVVDVNRLALEEVGHEDLVLVLLVTGCKDIGTLESLVLEAENVVDDEDGLLCIARTSGIGLHAIDGCVSALCIVALANDRRDGTASVRLHCGLVSDGSGMCSIVEEGTS